MVDGVCRTRFAPSPSGELHLGHIFAALEARRIANETGGMCLLRIEDIDGGRCREEYVSGIIEDLAWLGIRFDGDVIRQSGRLGIYTSYIDRLKDMGVLYPCFCTRKMIAEELAHLSSAPHEKVIDPYPGRCRGLSSEERERRISAGEPCSWRLDCTKAASIAGQELRWNDLRFGEQVCRTDELGDIILARKDCHVSYHVAVVVDDAAQGITHVTRGEDLLESTHVHRLLQELWGFDVPVWYHHRLILDDKGKRLAKRDQSMSVREMKKKGMTQRDVLGMVNDSINRLTT